MAKTDVPETVVCPNCNHNVVIQIYQVDTTINSSQGHFHTVHHRREPAYTVYCINCGHFVTNDPTGTPPKPAPGKQEAGKARAGKPGAGKPAAARQEAAKPAARKAPAKQKAAPPARQAAPTGQAAPKKSQGK